LSGHATSGRPAFAALLAAITLAGLLVRSCGLAGQPPLEDDRAAGVTAANFVERGHPGPTMWHHPRLRDLLVYATTSALGETKLGLVLPSLLLGVLSIPIIGLLGRRLAGPAAGTVAAAFVALDPLHVDYSRQAVQEVYTFFFGAAGVLLALRHAKTRRPAWLLASGVTFGLGAAAKWSVLFPMAVTAAWLVVAQLRDREASRSATAARIAFTLAALGALPATVYLLTWTPWFVQGRDLRDWLELQRAMAAEARIHAGFNAWGLDLPHEAWRWFVLPVAFADFTFGPAGPIPIVAIANPAVWLLTLPAVLQVARRGFRERRPEDALLVALFAGTYLPFLLTSRPIWLHSALAVLPFPLIAVAALLVGLQRRGARARLAIGAYAAVVLAVALPLLALATGRAMDIGPLRRLAEFYRPAARFEEPPK